MELTVGSRAPQTSNVAGSTSFLTKMWLLNAWILETKKSRQKRMNFISCFLLSSELWTNYNCLLTMNSVCQPFTTVSHPFKTVSQPFKTVNQPFKTSFHLLAVQNRSVFQPLTTAFQPFKTVYQPQIGCEPAKSGCQSSMWLSLWLSQP